jgi:hypothetical protein
MCRPYRLVAGSLLKAKGGYCVIEFERAIKEVS